MEGRSGSSGTGRLRGAGLVKFDLSGSDAHDAATSGGPDPRARAGRGGSRDHPAGGSVYALPSAADTIGVFQVGAARMARCPAAAGKFYDLVEWGSAHPAGLSRVAPCTPTAPAQRRGGGHVPAPVLETAAQGRWACVVPGAAHADGDRRGGFTPARRISCARRWAPTVEGAHGRMRSAQGGDGERGITGATAEDIAKKLEAFASRLPREPLRELRLPRVLERVDQAALPGGVRCGLLNAQPRASTRRTHSCATRASRGGSSSVHRTVPPGLTSKHDSTQRGAGPARSVTLRGLACGSSMPRGAHRAALRRGCRARCLDASTRREAAPSVTRGLHPPTVAPSTR